MKEKKANNFIISLILLVNLVLFISCSDDLEQSQSSDPGNSKNIDSTDNINPTISIMDPIDGSIQTNLFNVQINADDNESLQKVELHLNNVNLGFDSEAPYVFSIDIAPYPSGTYTLKGVAFDSSANSAHSEISVVIAKPTFDAPLDLIASQGDYNNKVVLNWISVPDATNYQVYKLSEITNEYELIGETSNNNFNDTDVESPLTQYFYKVKVYNSETEFGKFSSNVYGYTNSHSYNVPYTFGEEGPNIDQFGFVALISINDNDELFLSDGGKKNIKKFNIDGTFVGLFKTNIDSRAPIFIGNKTLLSNEYNLIIEENDIEIFNDNTQMNLVGQFAVDADNHFYVPVNYNPVQGYEHHKIYKYDLNGNYITSFGSKGNGDGEIDEPWGLSVFNDLIVVTDQANAKATFFDKNGNFVKDWDFSNITNNLYGNFVKDGYIYIAAGDFIIKTDFSGEVLERIGEGLLDIATSVVVDSSDNIIVTEPYNRKIKVLNKN